MSGGATASRLDASLVGTELDVVSFPIERGKVAELARALGDDDPVYRDEAAARAAGHDGIPAPLTATVLAMHWRDRAEDQLAIELGLDLARVLHGETEWKYLAPVNVGDELTGRRRIVDVTTREGRRGGAMTLLTWETEFTNQHGEAVVCQRDTLIERSAS